MATTKVGSRITIRGAGGPLVLRALRAVELEGGWAVPVMADLSAVRSAGVGPEADVEIDVVTEAGVLRLDAEIVHSGGMFVVRAPGLRTAAVTEQRRENVRAAISMAVRGTVLSTGAEPAAEPVTRHDGPAGPRKVLEGTTSTVSAGGLCVVFGALPPGARDGAQLYLELTMPSGDLAPAVVSVVQRKPVEGGVLARVRFLDISPLDSERLVRMVFARQRSELAERRSTPRPNQLPS